MNTALRKALLTGLGAAVVTKEKAEAAFADFVKDGRISATDAQALAHKLADDGRREFESVRTEIETKIKDLAARADPGMKARIEALEARIAELEKAKARTPRPRAAAKAP